MRNEHYRPGLLELLGDAIYAVQTAAVRGLFRLLGGHT